MKPFAFLILCGFPLFNAAAQSTYEFLSPKPNARHITINHRIILRQGNKLDISSVRKENFSIQGEQSGVHDFEFTLSADEKTLILSPAENFSYSETVTVKAANLKRAGDRELLPGIEFRFETQREYSAAEKERFAEAGKKIRSFYADETAATASAEADQRDLEDCFEITVNNNPAPGSIFFDTHSSGNILTACTGYQAITTGGDSVFFRNVTPYYADFKINLNGYLSVFNDSALMHEVMDSNFVMIDRYSAANGYETDLHDFVFTPNGHVLLIALEYQVIDMTVFDPSYSPAATVVGTVIQELDAAKNPVFEWRSFDHIEITEAPHLNLALGFIDYVHTNSLEVDYDGNIISSHRHLDQVMKINRSTGEVIWRLGGINNDFTFINETAPFTYQHDARRLSNGHLTLYDNGNFHSPPRSYTKEYQLDEVNLTAELVWSFFYPDINGVPVFFQATGSAQRLPNGNTFICGGFDTPFLQQPNMFEVTQAGEIVWEITLQEDKNIVPYRGRKYDWNPCSRPSFSLLKAVNISSASAKLKWNAANGAVKYRVQYRKKGTTSWKQATATSATKTVNGLLPDTKYEWRVQSWCDEQGDLKSGFTAIKQFKTLPLKPAAAMAPAETVMVYPNPADNDLIVEFKEEVYSPVCLRLLNALGQEVLRKEIPDGGKQIHTAVAGVNSGVYLLILESKELYESKLVMID